jgi:hypothetical protein
MWRSMRPRSVEIVVAFFCIRSPSIWVEHEQVAAPNVEAQDVLLRV